MSESNKAVLVAANAAISSGDYEGFLAHCTEDTEWQFVGDRTLRGKDAVRQWMAETYKEPPEFEVTRMVAEDDYVVAFGRITLKDDDGQASRHAYCDVWRLSDGKLAELRAFVIGP